MTRKGKRKNEKEQVNNSTACSSNFYSVNRNADDVTGSVYEAYNSSPDPATFDYREYTMTDSWDVDAFKLDYFGTNDVMFKIDIKNRSVSDEAKMINGIVCKGSDAKDITLWYIDTSTSILSWEASNIYAVPRNTDMSIYVNPLYYDEWVFTVNNKAGTGNTSSNKYQLAIHQL